jgi:hypothetical protein
MNPVAIIWLHNNDYYFVYELQGKMYAWNWYEYIPLELLNIKHLHNFNWETVKNS